MLNLTDRSVVKELCDKYGFSFSKGFGQNFLVNPGVCPKICDTAEVDETSYVLEVGPGFGTLTQQLALRARQVVSLEVDDRLLPVLEETLADVDNVTILHQDVMKADLRGILSQFEEKATVCANLPYYITSPVLMRLLEERLPLRNITVMVQKEAAERITAMPGTRAAGAISYAVHYFAQPKMAFSVQPGSFYPPPKVTSAVIRLDVREHTLLQDEPERERRLFRLVRTAFGQRRKTLANAVSAGLSLDKQAINTALEKAGLSPLVRPEQLTLEQFVSLEKTLWP